MPYVDHDEPVLIESEQGARWMMPISYCACCDEGRDPLDIPDTACGCSETQRRTTSVEVMPVIEHEAALTQVVADRDWNASEVRRLVVGYTPLLDARKMTIDEYHAALLKERDR